ncbi:hypothetical protein B0H16DRAFT_115164 [Mycena metata]|uniref:Uncharacterized protein n=1 Tax=Mycena metata TaxID=1033252 RepID=A0AAD7JXS6_9AGAR|nr:hypothetical protein B0H16DRAFT_115164 [Mycena metata]
MQTRKRPRVESSGGAPADPVRSDIWFEDGNIIVQVLKSAVDDMEESKGVDGCPLLFLSDSAIELSYVLRALFYRAYPDNAPLAFDVIVAFLRLGRKYEMKALYDGALIRITKAFPSSVKEYPQMISEFITEGRRHKIAAGTIIIARELQLLHLLPAAFWSISLHFKLLGGDEANSLSEADKKTIISAVNPLRLAYADYLFGWLDEAIVPSPDCSKPNTCGATKARYSLSIWRPPGLSLRFGWNPDAATGLCKQCIALGKKHHTEGGGKTLERAPFLLQLAFLGRVVSTPPELIQYSALFPSWLNFLYTRLKSTRYTSTYRFSFTLWYYSDLEVTQ